MGGVGSQQRGDQSGNQEEQNLRQGEVCSSILETREGRQGGSGV